MIVGDLVTGSHLSDLLGDCPLVRWLETFLQTTIHNQYKFREQFEKEKKVEEDEKDKKDEEKNEDEGTLQAKRVAKEMARLLGKLTTLVNGACSV